MFQSKKFTTKKMVTLAILSALGIPLMYVSFAPLPAVHWLKFDFSDLVVYIAAVIYGPLGAVIVAFIKSVGDYLLKGSEVGIPINQFIAFVSSLTFVIPFYYTMELIKKVIKSNSKVTKAISFGLSVLFLSVSFSYVSALWINYVVVYKLGYPVATNFVLWVTLIILPFLLTLFGIVLPIIVKVYKVKDALIIRVVPLLAGTLSLTVILTTLNYLWFTPWYLGLLGWDLPQPFLNYVLATYAPFNLAKGLVISSVFMLLSYRLEHLAVFLNSEDEQYKTVLALE
jgi:riboflavin transporter